MLMPGNDQRMCIFFGIGPEQCSRGRNSRSRGPNFIIADSRKIIPIGSKSATSSKHASLDRFMIKYSPKIEKAYVIHSKNLRTDGKIVYLPVYMTMFL
jgi:hypothetical protein